MNEDQTQQRFIDPILKKLGHDWTPEARRKVGSRTDGKTLDPDYAFLGFERQLDVNDDEEKEFDSITELSEGLGRDKKPVFEFEKIEIEGIKYEQN